MRHDLTALGYHHRMSATVSRTRGSGLRRAFAVLVAVLVLLTGFDLCSGHPHPPLPSSAQAAEDGGCAHHGGECLTADPGSDRASGAVSYAPLDDAGTRVDTPGTRRTAPCTAATASARSGADLLTWLCVHLI